MWNEEVYELNAITYRVEPASYLATKFLEQLSHEVENTEPVLAEIILNFTYLDDLMIGTNDESKAICICQGIYRLFASAGFRLCKYQSNSNSILQKINPRAD